MLTRQDYLLLSLSEECGKIQKNISKSVLFGIDNFHPDTKISNKKALIDSINDTLAILDLVVKENIIDKSKLNDKVDLWNRQGRYEKWLDYAISIGKVK